MFWLAVFTEFGLKAFKTGCTNGDAWCNSDKEITSPQARLTYYMVPSLQNFWALVVFKPVFFKVYNPFIYRQLPQIKPKTPLFIPQKRI